jgi:putative peptidoglycan lipid II flippase
MSEPVSELRHTTRSAGTIGIITLAASAIGFILQLLTAYYFGASKQTDAYFMAQSTSEMLSKLLLGGSITSVFIPLFVERITHKKMEEAWDLALNLLHITGLVMLVIVIALGYFALPFVHLIAPGFDGDTSLLTARLLQVLLPSFLLLFVVNIFIAMLNSLHHFTLPASLRAVAPLISVISVLLSVRSLGIFSLAVGALLGSFIQVLLVVIAASREGFRYRFILAPNHPALRRLAILVSPFVISVLVTQVAGIVYRVLVSHLASGSLAALKYGDKITSLFGVLLLQSVTTVLYPLLSRKASQKDYIGMRETLSTAIRLITFITVPVVVMSIIFRVQLVALLYQHGSFHYEDTLLTSTALLYLVIGLTTNGISALLGYTVLALQETKTAVAVTIASQVVAIALFMFLTPLMGVAGLAFASSLVPLASAALYLLYLRRYLPQWWLMFYHVSFLKTAVLGACLAAVIALAYRLPLWTSFSVVDVLSRLLVFGAVGVGMYSGLAYIWKVPELHEVVNIFRDKLHV